MGRRRQEKCRLGQPFACFVFELDILQQNAVVGRDLRTLANHFHRQWIMNQVRPNQMEFAEANFRVEVSEGIF